MMNDQSCGACKFYDSEGSIGQGLCRRYPPTVHVLPKPGPIPGTVAMQKMSCYPPVTGKDRGCAEYVGKIEIQSLQGDYDEGSDGIKAKTD